MIMNIENVEDKGNFYVFTFDGGKMHCVPKSMKFDDIKVALLEVVEVKTNSENNKIMALKGHSLTSVIAK